MIFMPYRQDPAHLGGQLCILIRTTAPVETIAPAIRQTIRAIDPNLPLTNIQTAGEQMDVTLVAERVTASLSGLFGVLPAVLVIVGLYGLLAYSVESRTSEIGIRTALGATRTDVIGMVLRESVALVVLGLTIGLPLARAASNVIASQLFEIKPSDPVTFAGVAALLLVASAGAAIVPAGRAGSIEPMEALRREWRHGSTLAGHEARARSRRATPNHAGDASRTPSCGRVASCLLRQPGQLRCEFRRNLEVHQGNKEIPKTRQGG
jgi:predicted lysophospholipase L1 biosynthesis ABC-type transport system permease subunit